MVPMDSSDTTKPSIDKTQTVDFLCLPSERIAPDAARVLTSLIC